MGWGTSGSKNFTVIAKEVVSKPKAIISKKKKGKMPFV